MNKKHDKEAPDAPVWQLVREEVERNRELAECILKAVGSNCDVKPPRRVVRAKGARQITGDGNSTFWARQNPQCAAWDPDFPRAFKLGNGSRSHSVWFVDEIENWIAKRAAMSPQRSPALGQRKSVG